MAKISLAGFKDPVRRPRYIIWTIVAVLVIITVMIPVLGVTSSYWFCSQGCHKVQDDTILAYNHSSHSKISCMTCHMPLNANPVIFLIHKAEALGELYMTVTNNFELPLNAEDEVALTMKTTQCTQCHNILTRKFSPSPGIKIDHTKHSDKSIPCTICHNRVAHNEDFDLKLKNPKTKLPNEKHQNFMAMTACFRCHGQEDNAPAPGACDACHTSGFQLKPASHLESGFFPKGHAEMAKSYEETATEAMKEANLTTITPEVKSEWEKSAKNSTETLGQKLIPVKAVFYCGTCHKEQFCTGCHGTPMPHSDEFKAPTTISDPLGHPALSKTIPKKCVMCHGDNAKTWFCDDCHHGTKLGYTFVPSQPWVNQHPKAVAKAGVKACTTDCHTTKFCSDCHTSRHVVPSSHRQATWVHPSTPAKSVYASSGIVHAAPSAKHALAAQQSIESCQVCHGSAGINSPFCKACHKTQLPHSQQFKNFHGATGQKNPAICMNCHGFKELCSNCHHVGSSNTVPWINVHGSAVDKNGPDTCIVKCHKKSQCVACHTARKVMPASHNAGFFVKRPGTGLGNHAALYKKSGAICTYCHAGTQDTLPNSKFCTSCHKLPMPHTIDESNKQKFEHKTELQKGTYKRATCLNCHEQKFCDNCHHPGGAKSKTVWVHYHPVVVRKNGATPCFDCHQETFCSDCHVNRASKL